MKILLGLFCLLSLSVLSLKAQTAPLGVWNTGTDNAQIEIVEVDGNYVGTLIASDNPEAKIGKQLIKDFKPDGEGWTAKLYAPKRGEWIDASLETKDNLLLITVGSGLMSKTLKWTKQ
ncbi:MAG: DUF2147 domain-containing protein [Bacteroidota bacterium]